MRQAVSSEKDGEADWRTRGGVAQLGERLLCKQEVIGSIPFTSTNRQRRLVPPTTAHCESNEREWPLGEVSIETLGAQAKDLCVDASRKPGDSRSVGSPVLCLSRQRLIFDMVKSVLLRAEAVASGAYV